MHKTTLSHVLIQLQNAGMIDLEANGKDGRSKCVWITAKGKSYQEVKLKEILREMTDVVEMFDFLAMQNLKSQLADIRNILEYAHRTQVQDPDEFS